MVKLIGNAGNQVPTNNMLGNMAFQNKEGVAVDLLGLAAGTAAAPSLIPSGDPNTGVWFPAADTIAMSTNGSERLRLNSTGTLSIGGTTALGRLTIKQGSDAVTGGIAVIRSTTDNQYGLISNHSGATFISSVDAVNAGNNITVFNRSANGTTFTESMRIDSAGNVGIGTTSPSAKLSVSDAAEAKLNLLIGSVERAFINYNEANSLMRIDSDAGIIIATNNTERIRIDSLGNVGLSITPSAWGSEFAPVQLGLSGAVASYKAGTSAEFMFVLSNAYNDNTNFRYIRDGAATRYDLNESSHKWFTSPSGTLGNVITFTQAMTLDSNGNLAIGQTSTTQRLAVKGGSGNTLLLDNGGEQYTQLIMQRNGALNSGGDILIDGTNSEFSFRSLFVGAMRFMTSASAGSPVERMRIDSNGNVVVNAAAIATNATNGFLYVPSCPGTPTGTPTAYTGRVPIVVDTTNRKLYFYADGAWRDAGP